MTARGYDFDAFEKELLAQFPKTRDSDEGSRATLTTIIQRYKPIAQGQLNKLYAFHQEFDMEMEKLLSPPAIMSNRECVTTYLGVLSPEFQMEVWRNLTDKIIKEKNEGNPRRKEDPWTFDEVKEMTILLSSVIAEDTYLSNAVPERGMIPSYGQSNSATAPKKSANSLIPVQQWEPLPSSSNDHPRPLDKKIKEESVDSPMRAIAASVDAHEAKL